MFSSLFAFFDKFYNLGFQESKVDNILVKVPHTSYYKMDFKSGFNMSEIRKPPSTDLPIFKIGKKIGKKFAGGGKLE